MPAENKAFKLGQQAFKKKIRRVPLMDKNLVKLIDSVPDAKPFYRAWIKGWDQANMGEQEIDDAYSPSEYPQMRDPYKQGGFTPQTHVSDDGIVPASAKNRVNKKVKHKPLGRKRPRLKENKMKKQLHERAKELAGIITEAKDYVEVVLDVSDYLVRGQDRNHPSGYDAFDDASEDDREAKKLIEDDIKTFQRETKNRKRIKVANVEFDEFDSTNPHHAGAIFSVELQSDPETLNSFIDWYRKNVMGF